MSTTKPSKQSSPETTFDLRLCEDHIRKLQQALCACGLEPLMVSDRSGRTLDPAMAHCHLWTKHALKDTQPAVGYEPEVATTMTLVRTLVGEAGGDMVSHAQLTKIVPCPLCFVMLRCRCNAGAGCKYAHVIERAAELERDRACSLGLIGLA